MTQENHNYASYVLPHQSEIVDVPDIFGTSWFFRGQADSEWAISSSLEREVDRLISNRKASIINILSEFEAASLVKIKSASSIEPQIGTGDRDDFSWLALLQHHGCKTRLVDFTESFYVALYFAVRDLSGVDAAVWAIGKSVLDAKIILLGQQHGFEMSEIEMPRRLVNNSIELPDRYQDDGNLAIVYSKPERLNQRIIAQQGLFLCPLNLKNSFMENLTIGLGLSGNKKPVKKLSNLDEFKEAAKIEKVIKICIPKTEHRNLLFHLRKMNISDATLFPGLDGFARSINYYISGDE
jgi:hypothetical protein